MDKMIGNEPNVKILGANLYGTTICAAASRISTTNGSAISLFEKSIDNPNNEKLVKNVLLSGHQSIMEHCFFNIAFNNVSAFVEQYMIEFRLASFTVQSRRYVDFSNVGFFTDPHFSTDIASRYDTHMKNLFDTYEKLLELGIPKEDARFVLPYCFHSNFYCSCNARELLHIICTMLYGRGRAFEELLLIGNELALEFERYFPNELGKHKDKYSVEKEKTEKWAAALSDRKCDSLQSVVSNTQLLSHSTLSSSDIFESTVYNFAAPDDEADNKYELLYNTRARELELISLSFKIRDISLSAITHLVRHRMQSVLVPCVGNAIYKNRHIVPDSVSANEAAKNIYEEAFLNNVEVFHTLIENGMDPIHCVYFALSGNTMDVISSMNGREFAHFTQLRTCNRAQWEIRKISEDMLKLSREIYPDIFSKLGPSCFINGKCPEGKKTCGHIAEVKERFSKF